MSWEVVGRPVGKNEEGKNSGALVIELKNTSNGYSPGQEIARVAFERKEGHYKDTSYEEQVDIEVGKALKTIEAINKLAENAGKLV